MPTFKLTLAYDGTDFDGWQVQPGGRRTVQGVLEPVLATIADTPVRVAAAGRTDSGVHAEGQVASVTLQTGLAPETLRRALNAQLPLDVEVRRVERVPESFHARYDARAKRYRYRVWNARERDVHRDRTHHHVPQRLDLEAVARAGRHFEGEHDFAALAAARTAVKTTVRTLHRVAVWGAPGAAVVFEVDGTGFLRHMVRNLVGTLIEVGQGRRSEESLGAMLAARDRTQAGPTAPARGLCLVWVLYGPGPSGPTGCETASEASHRGDSPAATGGCP